MTLAMILPVLECLSGTLSASHRFTNPWDLILGGSGRVELNGEETFWLLNFRSRFLFCAFEY